MIEVYHLHDEAFFDDTTAEQKIDSRYYNVNIGFKPEIQKDAVVELFNEGYYFLVAVVDTQDLSDAWHKTNHVEKPWYSNEDVQTVMNEARSSKVGDVMKDENGNYHIVASIGFTEIEPGKIKGTNIMSKIRRTI